jgi:hypothetical protein
MIIECRSVTHTKKLCVNNVHIFTDLGLNPDSLRGFTTAHEIAEELQRLHGVECVVRHSKVFVYDSELANALKQEIVINTQNGLYEALSLLSISNVSFALHTNKPLQLNFCGTLKQFLEFIHEANLCFDIHFSGKTYVINIMECASLMEYDLGFIRDLSSVEKNLELILKAALGGNFCINDHMLYVTTNCKGHFLIEKWLQSYMKKKETETEVEVYVIEIITHKQSDPQVILNALAQNVRLITSAFSSSSSVSWNAQQIAYSITDVIHKLKSDATCHIRSETRCVIPDGRTFKSNTGISKDILLSSHNRSHPTSISTLNDTQTNCQLTPKLCPDGHIHLSFSVVNKDIAYEGKNSHCQIEGSVRLKDRERRLCFHRTEKRTIKTSRFFGLFNRSDEVYVVTLVLCRAARVGGSI